MELLKVKPGGFFVDGTLGLAGHAREILRRSTPSGRLLGVDRDAETLEMARQSLAPFGDRALVVQADYRQIPALLKHERADGILLDLGVSSYQLGAADRGFSFQVEGPLDMRFDRCQGETAAEVVNRAPEHRLKELIDRLGEDPGAGRIARAIVSARRRRRISTTTELAALIRNASKRSGRPGLHPATRTFQALRIHVNRELDGLDETLSDLARCLRPGGRLVVIAFHSLEDRFVKQTFRSLTKEGFVLLTRKPIRPSPSELLENPRARSARLRAVEQEEAA